MDSLPKKHWLGFSLRALLVLMTILCVWIGFEAKQAKQQQEAVAWVLSVGGDVTYDYEFSDFDQQYLAPHPDPAGPDWLVGLVGVDFFASVVAVDIVDAQVHDLSALKALSNLKLLHLESSQIGDMSTIAELTNLQHLGIREVQMSDLSPLASLVNLKELLLDSIPASDLSPLASLSQLEYIGMLDVPVSEREVERLRQSLPECTIDGP